MYISGVCVCMCTCVVSVCVYMYKCVCVFVCCVCMYVCVCLCVICACFLELVTSRLTGTSMNLIHGLQYRYMYNIVYTCIINSYLYSYVHDLPLNYLHECYGCYISMYVRIIHSLCCVHRHTHTAHNMHTSIATIVSPAIVKMTAACKLDIKKMMMKHAPNPCTASLAHCDTS